MLATGLITVIGLIVEFFRTRHSSEFTVLLAFVIFVTSIYYRHKKNSSEEPLLGSDAPGYSSIESQE
jgi:ABC-type Mn2+/Zn2+ transport system permease subunit